MIWYARAVEATLLSPCETESRRIGHLIDGLLGCSRCAKEFTVRGGVARFVDEASGYNPSWNYKWTAIDRGRALN